VTELRDRSAQVCAAQPLNLPHNQLTELPESFGQLTALQKLNLKNNELTALPKSFGQLTALRGVDSYGSQLQLDDRVRTTAADGGFFGGGPALDAVVVKKESIASAAEENEQLRRKARRLEEAITRATAEDDPRMCVICMEKEKSVLLNPCKHICLCGECCTAVISAENNCPVCRTLITDVIRDVTIS
jgi:hypothetical protein